MRRLPPLPPSRDDFAPPLKNRPFCQNPFSPARPTKIEIPSLATEIRSHTEIRRQRLPGQVPGLAFPGRRVTPQLPFRLIWRFPSDFIIAHDQRLGNSLRGRCGVWTKLESFICRKILFRNSINISFSTLTFLWRTRYAITR